MDKYLNKLDASRKQLLFWVLSILMIVVCYQFSLRPAISAYRLNSTLNRQLATNYATGSATNIAAQKAAFYNKLLQRYRVKAANWDNALWQSLSGIALATNVAISYQPERMLTDTAGANGILQRTFEFSAGYKDLVLLLDSIHRSPGIGRIATATIKTPERNEQVNNELVLKLTLAGLTEK